MSLFATALGRQSSMNTETVTDNMANEKLLQS
jgi:hypothetical protein